MSERENIVSHLSLQIFDLTKRVWLQAAQEKLDEAYDLSESEFLALDALEDVDSLTVGELREKVDVLPAQMSRIIKALEERYDEKLVVCSINAEDKRKIDVAVTTDGRRAVDAYRRAKINSIYRALQVLSDGDLGDLGRVMDRLQIALEGRTISSSPEAASN